MESTEHNNHKVRIHIDRQSYESPNPTTGAALYELGNVTHNHDLYREVRGDQEDKPVPNGHEVVHLREDEHFYSSERQKAEYTIIVNGRKKVVHSDELTFDQIVSLAFETPPTGINVVFTVTYRGAAGHRPEGSLVAGEKIKIKDGTIFNVTATDKS